MIYIPTITSKLRYKLDQEYDNVLYSPNPKMKQFYKAKNITIWDNHTFYLLRHLKHPNKQEIAYEHYNWFINFVKENWEEGITVITPDVDWHDKQVEIEQKWLSECAHIPQLYVVNTWQSDVKKLNIVGHALRLNSNFDAEHPEWTHCLGHVRDNLTSKLLTYDSISAKF
jgi:hypothetical protein